MKRQQSQKRAEKFVSGFSTCSNEFCPISFSDFEFELYNFQFESRSSHFVNQIISKLSSKVHKKRIKTILREHARNKMGNLDHLPCLGNFGLDGLAIQIWGIKLLQFNRSLLFPSFFLVFGLTTSSSILFGISQRSRLSQCHTHLSSSNFLWVHFTFHNFKVEPLKIPLFSCFWVL